ncbi:MAG: hypothetical protein AVDCRST_MAG88-1450 [uncultured Thermomicrobiales bacterium]|uniref:PNPLA domain-containing protein n=1 Tax=uncultured Thermomicrobiales bacterium TaxID=1645740 RepID=A0A6J4UVG6_9BACT|nr:MAG: hypothetical protein AVDCRST_MAG88-1450 [uncultured Thermomicrobiales bacterium]
MTTWQVPTALAAASGQTRRRRIGLALSSGGARGFAHVGVIKALEQAGCSIVSVAGSSIGSIVGAGYAHRGDVAEVERQVLAFRARDHQRPGGAVMHSERIAAVLDTLLGAAHFADCAVPLTIMATDLRRRAPVAITAGPVALAACASMALPFFHHPVPWEDRLLAEGALSCDLPLAQAGRVEVDLVVGSMVSQDREARERWLATCARRAGRATADWQRPYADFFRAPNPPAMGREVPATMGPPVLIITPHLPTISAVDFDQAQAAIAAGECATAARLDELADLMRSAAAYPAADDRAAA